MVLGNVAIKKPAMLIIDEPELNLHPSLQVKFLKVLAKYSQHVVFASHSLGLARTAEHVWSVTKVDGRSEIKPLAATRNYAELLGEMGFEAYRELGYEQVLGVEGVTDVSVIQHFLRLLKLDHKVVVIPLGGESVICGGREQELGELKRLTNRVSILIDSERGAAGEALSPARTAFAASCTKLQIRIHVTERRGTENYLTDAAIKKQIGAGYRALLPYEDFKAMTPRWGKGENWKIAQHMDRGDLMATDIGPWLEQLGQ
jgi:hypothetical protein